MKSHILQKRTSVERDETVDGMETIVVAPVVIETETDEINTPYGKPVVPI